MEIQVNNKACFRDWWQWLNNAVCEKKSSVLIQNIEIKGCKSEELKKVKITMMTDFFACLLSIHSMMFEYLWRFVQSD